VVHGQIRVVAAGDPRGVADAQGNGHGHRRPDEPRGAQEVSGQIAVRLIGVSEFRASLDEMVEGVRAASELSVKQAAALVEREVKTELKQTAHKKGTPTPSAPGSPPSTVSGTLARSEQTEGPEEIGFGHYEAKVGPTIIYGRIQELGGMAGKDHKSKLPPRPSLGPAVDARQSAILAIAVRNVQAALSQ
jgi:phage gpG-like protein